MSDHRISRRQALRAALGAGGLAFFSGGKWYDHFGFDASAAPRLASLQPAPDMSTKPAAFPEVQWSRKVPVRYEADVAVVGGGMAGVSAACAAAREGASVVLVERFAVTGGNATVGGVANWSGETRGQGAVFDEILRMQEEWGSIVPYPGTYHHFIKERVFDHEILAVILQELLLKHGVKLLLHTRFVDARLEGNRVSEAMVCGSSGPEALRARVFVDCTGEALVAHAAGFATVQGRGSDGVTLPPSMMFFMRKLEGEAKPQLPPGWFQPVARKEDLPMNTIWPNGPGGVALKLKVPGFFSGDTESMTALEVRARRRMWEVLDYYQRVEKKPWHFDHCSPRIGLREGRRIVGDYVLNVDDVKAGRGFDDGVARGVYILDAMSPDTEKRIPMVDKSEAASVKPYQIPLRSLVAKDGANLLMAGRCFSADQLALSSARVMPTCSMMGQAAGICAALAAARKRDPREVEARAVRGLVEKHGANLQVG
jgi:hypothetical protein